MFVFFILHNFKHIKGEIFRGSLRIKISLGFELIQYLRHFFIPRFFREIRLRN